MQLNLNTNDMDYLVSRTGLPKSRIHQIVRKANLEVFVFLTGKVFDEVD